MNKLFFGDNLVVLRDQIAPESVDLVYLDPPFNSNADYNLLYGTKRGGPSKAQSHAFEDTWKWGPDAKKAMTEAQSAHLQAGSLLESFERIFPGSDMMAYLAMMTVRLIYMHRVLKPTGSLYLHCDPTASHYLKIVLDTIFGAKNFRNEISWKRTSSHNDAAQGLSRFGRMHDVVLFYRKDQGATWNTQFAPYSEGYMDQHYGKVDPATGRRYKTSDLTAAKPGGDVSYEWRGVRPPAGRYWAYSRANLQKFHDEGRLHYSRGSGMPRLKQYLDAMPGVALGDFWDDIPPINSQAHERLHYPTQKPLPLLERIVLASTNLGDVILDPFCGCGTAIEASQRLGREWIGIDITYLAIHVIETRLLKSFGPKIRDTYSLFGSPRDADDARALAGRNWAEFQKWAVLMLQGVPNEAIGADAGIDGIIRYHRVGIEQPNKAIVSVKGGMKVGVDDVHKLKSVMTREKAEMGVLVCINPPTPAMIREATSEGEVGPASRKVQKIQIVTVEDIFHRDPVAIPGMVDEPSVGRPMPSRQPKHRRKIEGQMELLLPSAGGQASEPTVRKPRRAIREVNIDVVRPERTRK